MLCRVEQGPCQPAGRTWRKRNWRRSLKRRACCSASAVETYDLFERWYRDQCNTIPSEIGPGRLCSAEGSFGMLARADIKKGDVLVHVPKPLMMSADTAASSPACGHVVKLEGITPWQALCLHLLCERALGEQSFWHPYLATLPDQVPHPLMWTHEQMEWLRGSPLLGRLQDRLKQVAEDVETLELAGANELPVAIQYLQKHQVPLVTVASVKWAAATILSRSFSLELELEEEGVEEGAWGDAAAGVGEEELWVGQEPSVCLVPWADLLNHSSTAGPESILRYDPHTGAATLAAHQDYTAGSQVFDSYGQLLSPGELLLDYGYSESPSTNDRFDILASEVVERPRGPRNRKLLAALEKLQGGPSLLSLQPDGPDQGTLTWMRAALATDAELIRGGWRVKANESSIDDAARALGRLSDPVSEVTEVVVLNALEAFVLQQLAQYPSTLQEDEQALTSGSLPWLQQQAVMAVASEKRALQGSLEAIARWRARLAEGVALEEVYLEEVEGWGVGEDGDEEAEEAEEWEEAAVDRTQWA